MSIVTFFVKGGLYLGLAGKEIEELRKELGMTQAPPSLETLGSNPPWI